VDDFFGMPPLRCDYWRANAAESNTGFRLAARSAQGGGQITSHPHLERKRSAADAKDLAIVARMMLIVAHWIARSATLAHAQAE